MKARIPKHREFIIDFPKEVSQEKADEGWEKLTALLEDYKKAHNGQSVLLPDLHRGPGARRKGTAGRVRLYLHR